MSLHYAVVMIDHNHAQVLQFDAEHLQSQKIKSHGQHTRQHGNVVRTEHEFFSEVCDALGGIAEIIVTGGHTAQADFKHYIGKHRPALMKQIAGWETINRPSEAQLLALAKKHFIKFDRMEGTAPLS
jgi:stalled ribosome rescue protein Dom34